MYNFSTKICAIHILEEERGLITGLKVNSRKISSKTRDAIMNSLKDPDNYGVVKRDGRKQSFIGQSKPVI